MKFQIVLIMKKASTFINNIYVKNITGIILITIILIAGVLFWLDMYTHHGEAVIVPDVKHMQVDEAGFAFEKAQLRYKVVDSIHVKNADPGSIVEMIPPSGSKVKTNRIIFLKINSFSAKTLILPEVKDLSQRQALAMLKAVGFENVSVKQVSSPYKDLVLGIEYKETEIQAGERIPEAGRLVLLVSSGEYDEDSISIDTDEEPIQDNSWF